MSKLALSKNLMIAAIVLLAAFQVYWLHKLYKDEYNGLKNEVDVTFRETIYKLQKQRFEKDTFLVKEFSTTFPITNIKKTPSNKRNNAVIVKKADQKLVNDSSINKLSFRISATSNDGMIFMQDSINKFLKGIDPSQIQTINIIKGKPDGINILPPPGLMEVILKQRAKTHTNTKDSIAILKDSVGKISIASITYKSSFSNTPSKEDSLQPTIEMITTPRRKPSKKPNLQFEKFSMTGYINNEKQDSSPIAKLFTSSKSINDSIPVYLVDSAYRAELVKTNKKLAYNLLFKKATKEEVASAGFTKDSSKNFTTSAVFIGYNTPYSYQASFTNIFSFIIKQMSWQIGGSLLLLLFVLATFISLYKNLLAQQRLAIIKNDFISNITHELKTPIATVNVAIEALRNFGGITSPERTKEYLDISASELQRLSLLVDKVLKLSMFENKDIDLSKEHFDLKLLTQEVINTLKLQFDKAKATATLIASGENYILVADKLHITSVIYNLLDNAIKYSGENAMIEITLEHVAQNIELRIKDNGIGIATEYKDKIFEKFFRVPTGNVHNTKGYGLGLSYVAHIVKKHQGTISVQSQVNQGSTFIIHLPTQIEHTV